MGMTFSPVLICLCTYYFFLPESPRLGRFQNRWAVFDRPISVQNDYAVMSHDSCDSCSESLQDGFYGRDVEMKRLKFLNGWQKLMEEVWIRRFWNL